MHQYRLQIFSPDNWIDFSFFKWINCFSQFFTGSELAGSSVLLSAASAGDGHHNISLRDLLDFVEFKNDDVILFFID